MDNLNTPDNMSKNTHTKLFKLQFLGASGNNNPIPGMPCLPGFRGLLFAVDTEIDTESQRDLLF